MLRAMAIEIRTVGDDELAAWRDCVFTTFGDDASVDPDGEARTREMVPPRQRWAAYDGATIVATAGTLDLEIGLPGGATIPIAGLTMVTVRPSHRRRGLMRRLVQAHLDDARARGFAISGLWASEAAIYGRFGYGIATQSDSITIDHASTVVVRAPSTDEVGWLDEAAAHAALPEIYARATAGRPGALRRVDTWWRLRRFSEAPFARGGASRLRHVVVRRDGAPVGYLQYRQRGRFDASMPSGQVEIAELIGVDGRAELALWQFALAVDLFPRVGWWNAPVDDPLAWAVADPRRVVRRRSDGMWLRIEDVATALAARGYATDGALRLAVDDAIWELVVEHGRARCARTTAAPELRLARATLGALYLGGASAPHLARAGLIDGAPDALARADHLFASAIAPWCAEVF